jgi:putative transposase
VPSCFLREVSAIVLDQKVDGGVKAVCLEIEKRYQVKFLEIGVDRDHVHFLVQTTPTYSVTRLIVTIIHEFL